MLALESQHFLGRIGVRMTGTFLVRLHFSRELSCIFTQTAHQLKSAEVSPAELWIKGSSILALSGSALLPSRFGGNSLPCTYNFYFWQRLLSGSGNSYLNCHSEGLSYESYLNTSETQVGAALRSCRYSLLGGRLRDRNRLGDLIIFVIEWEEYSKQVHQRAAISPRS